MPRPATFRISVATMGETPTTATSMPFQQPRTAETASATRRQTARGVRAVWPGPSICATIAPEMARMEPTEISVPPVAMTSVMPMERIIRVAALLMMSITRP